jgi:hypothetical protein
MTAFFTVPVSGKTARFLGESKIFDLLIFALRKRLLNLLIH